MSAFSRSESESLGLTWRRHHRSKCMSQGEERGGVVAPLLQHKLWKPVSFLTWFLGFYLSSTGLQLAVLSSVYDS